VGRWLLDRVGSIIITTGPSAGEVEEARWLRDRLGDRVIASEGKADWPQTAGLLQRARLYVGTDTASMHLAAACGCPIVALFGSTWEGNWGPWQAVHRIVSEPDIPATDDPLEDLRRAKQRTMAAISPAKVIAACAELLR
jgi:heptosyltransferase-3